MEFRQNHAKLKNILSDILSETDDLVVVDLQDAYQTFLSPQLNVFDSVTAEGTRMWHEKTALYEKKLERIETSIIKLLEEKLRNAKSTDETFRLFSIFNPLFFRRAIWNAVGPFRVSLIRTVHEDISRLQEKFRLRYDDSTERATSDLRDIPPISGRILWARQIENQLSVLLNRMENVLGMGWEDQNEGKQLKEVCDELMNFLDVQSMFDSWTTSVSGMIKELSRNDTGVLSVKASPSTGKCVLIVNYDIRLVDLFKEVRHLEWLIPQSTIPLFIKKPADEAFERYPAASALKLALTTYHQAKRAMYLSDDKRKIPVSGEDIGAADGAESGKSNQISILLVAQEQSIRDLIHDALLGTRTVGSKQYKKRLNWNGDGLLDWVETFSRRVARFEEKVEDAVKKSNQVYELLQQLRICHYTNEAMGEVLLAIQSVVDEMQMRGFSNIELWVSSVDKDIEGIIGHRLSSEVSRWLKAFGEEVDPTQVVDDKAVSYGEELPLVLDETIHEVLLSNQVLYLSPAIEEARSTWITSLHRHLGVCCQLPRIITSRFDVFSASERNVVRNYSNLLFTIEADLLKRPYACIESRIWEAKLYVDKWLQYQTLWDVPTSSVTDQIGNDIQLWQQLLQGVKAARSTIENVSDEVSFGPIVINFHQVQNKVNLKYDAWQKEIQIKFASIVQEGIHGLHDKYIQMKRQLESLSLDGPTQDVISAVECILKAKASVEIDTTRVTELENSEKLLQKQRHQFGNNWLAASNMASAFDDLGQILNRRVTAMDSQLSSLQQKIRDEDVTLTRRIGELVSDWETNRPDGGQHSPADALQVLSMYSSQITKIKDDFTRIAGAKKALGIDIVDDNRMEYVAQEIEDLKFVWQSIAPVHEQLEELKMKKFKDIAVPKLRKELDALTAVLNSVHVKVRTYAPFDELQNIISKLMSYQPILRDIMSEALKERHWKSILKLLNLTTTTSLHYQSDLKLGDLWDAKMLPNKKLINELLTVAQGELALEQYLKEVKEYWNNYQMNFVIRDGGIRLITEWATIFTMLEDHLNSLGSLKQSPYFRNVSEFQEDTQIWESKLTLLRGICDVWIEVQRKWVYLHGIFRNADIKAQLPSQFTKFKGVDNEFSKLMKRTHLKPQIPDIVGIDGLLSQLERQDVTMTMIQKALGEYLEKQRQIFPRFYFVNNDDLVEIIGNSNEPAKILTHLSKMFSAIATLTVQDTETPDSQKSQLNALKICSKEGEEVTLTQPIYLNVDVKEWLQKLESEMVNTLATLLQDAMNAIPTNDEKLFEWVDQYPAQVVILASQVKWCAEVEETLSSTVKSADNSLSSVLEILESRLKVLSQGVLGNVSSALRKKCEQLITEVVHQRDVSRRLVGDSVASATDFGWVYHLRFYWNVKESNLMQRLRIQMSNASFFYGFEYLGIAERLVQTTLTDRCYLTLTQALHLRMGGNPFGPAGTGKTESVKMLGSQLGRFVLVFNCDENFDYAAMGRIFAGLCQVGAWGCFDEFNRLEERILSAVSQQILTIQRGLMSQQKTIQLLGNACTLHRDVGIFVTMNPGYAGRSNLPENLKQLFRQVAMVVPDRKMITQVMLFSQGITTAEELAGKIVLLFTLCEEQLTSQSHYDFGLRSLKSVLTGAGDLKRAALEDKDSCADSMATVEQFVLIRSTLNSVVPKLVAEDIPLFNSLLAAVFPTIDTSSANDKALSEAIRNVCFENNYECDDVWIEKLLQLRHVIDLRHGVMMVGQTCSGKTVAWRVLLQALAKVDHVKGEYFVIDPKSIKKDNLFGSLDANTLEWTDGVFTKLLRKVTEQASLRQVKSRRTWIVFDGDVDPEWAENLNSVLDDNKVLTLPSGDRLKLPDNVRILIEADSLKYTTLATVSRCGMVWFPDNTVSMDMMFKHLLKELKNETILSLDFNGTLTADQKEVQSRFLDVLTPFFSPSGLVEVVLKFSLSQPHVMEIREARVLMSLHSMLIRGLAMIFEYNENNIDLPMSENQLEMFSSKWLLFSLLWGIGASLQWEQRELLASMIMKSTNIVLPLKGAHTSLLQFTVDVGTGEWVEVSKMVPKMEIEAHKVTSTDVVVTTTDTVRHAEVLRAWLASHKPLVLCGPPGSGKTMTLNNVIETMPELIPANLNFSSGTCPELILKTFNQYCEIIDSPDGLVMQPSRQAYSEDKWLVVFCDEINLPEPDKYGTQRVVMFLRQLTEQGGFWNKECKWVRLKRIQFVGACNPPTDAGRVPLSGRFLRHSALLLVDYPAKESLYQIYHCFNHGLLKLHPNLKGCVDSLTEAMVSFYAQNQERFTPDIAPQYIYSPRELSRWVRALYEAMEPLESMTIEELVRLWAHEALRLFRDRLITDTERAWCDEKLDETARTHFPTLAIDEVLARPMMYSSWLSKKYQSVDKEELRDFVGSRLKVFYEEELDVPLVIFDDVLEHVLRIDNVLRHPMGHLLLVGESGVGKTVLSRFVSWMNGLKIFQIKANNRYTLEAFDEDLRGLLRRVGVDGEKVTFIFDESNALSSGFLERMNALLASGEVPGLFEGDDLSQLLSAMQVALTSSNVASSSGGGASLSERDDELWRSFTKNVQRNLHVIFTMNPQSTDFNNRCTTSPALFNRCVVDWFGTWNPTALSQVAYEFTLHLDTGYTEYSIPSSVFDGSPNNLSTSDEDDGDDVVTVNSLLSTFQSTLGLPEGTVLGLHEAVVSVLVTVHKSVQKLTSNIGKASGRQHYISPRDFLDLIMKFVEIEQEKRSSLEDQQTHIRTGLTKLLETQSEVEELQADMVTKEAVLRAKDAEANLKLTQMVEKQNEAESSKSKAEELSLQLTTQNEEIRVRKESVQNELSEAEPALISAKESVQNIRKSQLDEVRALGRPPAAVQSTMEMVCVMIGEKTIEWQEIRKVIKRDDFVSTVVNFDPMTLTARQVKKVQEEYLNNSELDYYSVDRASKACGPLFMWAQSQIKYSQILRKIKPLRDEVEQLETLSVTLAQQKDEATQQMTELGTAIAQYKADYASAIRDTETIRGEMEVVTKKVQRAEALLFSLQEEKDRWQETSTLFDTQMSTLIGDCLLAGSFLTYAGIFDHKFRRYLIQEWRNALESAGISYRPDLEMVGYLSTPSQLLAWKSCGLPPDELAVENGILLERFRRFPLVVDPSGQAMTFFTRKFADRKLTLTSFADASFLKTLASAVRFGTPLLVQDVEALDPILNPVLNKEFQKMGGRTLIRIGSEDIDYSPKFFIILVTRNPFARFAPDLCSRVTLVNFTVTPASLEVQALSKILQSERPDVDRKRMEVQRLQSEQMAQLRELEDTLLNKISAVQGNILNDDSLVQTLETIKAEAKELNDEVKSTEVVMAEVKETSSLYLPLATSMAGVYFSLENLSDTNFLYQFSLQFFLTIVDKILSTSKPDGETGHSDALAKKRLQDLSTHFYKEVARRVLRGLKFQDKVMFVTRLAQIQTENQVNQCLKDSEEDFLFRGISPVSTASNDEKLFNRCQSTPLGQYLRSLKAQESVVQKLAALCQLPAFSELLNSMERDEGSAWVAAYQSETFESVLPMDWMSVSSVQQSRQSLLILLVVFVLRPDRVMSCLDTYVASVFGESFHWRELAQVNLSDMVQFDSVNSVPIMLCSEAGQDPSGQVDSLAQAMNKSEDSTKYRVKCSSLLQVALGSAEGYADADHSISLAAKSGQWVLLRNVHLCPEWLSKLEKRLHQLTCHDNFRLFLTCEINEQVPTSILRASDVIFVEASTGIKANLQRFSSTYVHTRVEKNPVERSRLYMLLGWLNAVVNERLRYAPLGWTKRYEFSDADTQCAMECIDQWVDTACPTKSAHINPEELPWEALCTTLSQSLYGGRIANSFDQAALDSFIRNVFRVENYGYNAIVAFDTNSRKEAVGDSEQSFAPLVTLPNGCGKDVFESWIASLPDKNSPTWLGLPSTAENQLQSVMGQHVLSGLTVLKGVADDQSVMTSASSRGSSASSKKNKAMQSVLKAAKLWLSTLSQIPQTALHVNDKIIDAQATPLERFIIRESERGNLIMKRVSTDLDMVKSYSEGILKSTNEIRYLFTCFSKGQLPVAWGNSYESPPGLSIGAWVNNLADRCASIGCSNNHDETAGNIESTPSYWLGGMFSPEAFITATRQLTAQMKQWSLEELELYLDIGVNSAEGIEDTIVRNMILECAQWSEADGITLSSSLRSRLPTSRLRWRRREDKPSRNLMTFPVYLDETRANLVVEVLIEIPDGVAPVVWSQRGVAIVLLSV